LGFPIPVLFAWLAALAESVGAFLLALGLMTRIAAAMIAFTMAVAFTLAHAADPFGVKELAFLYGIVAVCLLLTGPGKMSLDYFLSKRR